MSPKPVNWTAYICTWQGFAASPVRALCFWSRLSSFWKFWSMISAFGFPRFSMFSSLKSFHGLAWVYWCHLQTELIEWLLKNQFRSFPSTMDYHVHTCSRSVMPDSFVIPWTVVRQAPLSRSFSGKNTGVGCHFLLQGIFPTRDWTFISWVFCVGRWVLYH